ncbi:MAG: hypothetical protein ACHQ5A_07210 [Opitutales bacterium]
MKRLLVLFCLLAVLGRADTPTFWKQLTPEERRAAGLDQLTPEQQAALDAVVARYVREGARQEVEVAKAQAKAEVKETVRHEVEEMKAQAAAEKSEAVRRAREEAKAEAKAEQQRKKIADAGLAVRSEDEPIHTRIMGDFRGWEGATVYTMENGQVWQQTDRENRFFPKIVNPEVILEPSKLFGWKMKLVGEGLWIRVRRIK